MAQDVREERGTPSHATANVVRTSKTDGVARSIGRDLVAVRKTLDGMSSWREGVEQHMAQSKEDMASVNNKLDMLLKVILPSGGSPAIRPMAIEQGTLGDSNSPSIAAEHTDVTDREHCFTGVTTGTDRTASASGVTEEMCTRIQTFPLPGDCKECIEGPNLKTDG